MIFIKWWHRGVCRCAGGTHLQEMSSGLKSVY